MFMFVYNDDYFNATFGETKRETLDKWLQEIGAKIEDIEPDLCQFWAPVSSMITQTVKQVVTYNVD